MGRINVSTTDYSRELGILRQKGLAVGRKDGIERHFAEVMNNVGLDPANLMATLAQLLNSAESDGIKLAAVKFATQLYMHPAVTGGNKTSENERPQINFVIDGTNVQINNVLTPMSQ